MAGHVIAAGRQAFTNRISRVIAVVPLGSFVEILAIARTRAIACRDVKASRVWERFMVKVSPLLASAAWN
jgi:hypothetical protein